MKIYHKYDADYHEVSFTEYDIKEKEGKNYSVHWDENSERDEPDDEFPCNIKYVVCPICGKECEISRKENIAYK